MNWEKYVTHIVTVSFMCFPAKLSYTDSCTRTACIDIMGHTSPRNHILITNDLGCGCRSPINLTVHRTQCGLCNLCSPLVGSSHLTNRTRERFIESYIWGSNHCIPYKIHLSGGQSGSFVKPANKLCEY